MALEDKTVERKILLKRIFPRHRLFEIGKNLNLPYFERYDSAWGIDEDQAAFEIAVATSDTRLKEIVDTFKARRSSAFLGKYYTFEDNSLLFEGSWKAIENSLHQIRKKYGRNGLEVLKMFLDSGKSYGLNDIAASLKHSFDPTPIVKELEKLKIIATSYQGDNYQEWKILEEVSPLVQSELGVAAPEPVQKQAAATAASAILPGETEELDYVMVERQEIERMDATLDEYLSNLLRNRLDSTIRFGKTFSLVALADYLTKLFGPVLYFDSLLSITQQYGLADTDIVHEHGKTGMRTGWNLSLFGEPGTGKSFSTRDMILGKPDAKISPHGIPGRNRYAGGITPARFIRIGQAYENRVFNFIVPEFNDWFRYKGMVEPLKLAMERGEIKYELHREVIGPYRFQGFFAVNYNVSTFGRGYEVTVQDPNFNAIEDRMLCRLHRLTKQRFVEIAQSQMRLAFGEIDIEKGARQIRDHLTLVHAIETDHPLVRARFPAKPVLITQEAYGLIEKARDEILRQIPKEYVTFSARLEDRALRFACAASLLNFFQSNEERIFVSQDAMKYAV